MALSERGREAIESVALPLLAMAGALLLFGVFIAAYGKSPVDAWLLLFKGAFGDWFSWQNTLQRAAPLMLTALCVAIPSRRTAPSASTAQHAARCSATRTSRRTRP